MSQPLSCRMGGLCEQIIMHRIISFHVQHVGEGSTHPFALVIVPVLAVMDKLHKLLLFLLHPPPCGRAGIILLERLQLFSGFVLGWLCSCWWCKNIEKQTYL